MAGAADVADLCVVFLAKCVDVIEPLPFFVIRACTPGVAAGRARGAASTLTDYQCRERGCRSVIS